MQIRFDTASDPSYFYITDNDAEMTPTTKGILLSMAMAAVFPRPSTAGGFAFATFVQESKDRGLTHEIAVSAVTIAVTVQDGSGRYINDLTDEDFRIYENNHRLSLTYFSHDDKAPLSLTILLDVSGSMALQDRLEESKQAIRNLLSYLLDDRDEVSLLVFADGEVEVAAGFTRDKSRILDILAGTDAYGQTALNDAVAVSPEYANKGDNEKRALLLITDGIENDSRYSPAQAVEIARRVDVPIYTIGYKIPLGERYLEKYKHSPSLTSSGIIDSLERFSEATGGKAFFVDRAFELNSALRDIKKELSHQYILGYTSYAENESEFTTLKVTTSNRRHKVRAREGYYGGEKEMTEL